MLVYKFDYYCNDKKLLLMTGALHVIYPGHSDFSGTGFWKNSSSAD